MDNKQAIDYLSMIKACVDVDKENSPSDKEISNMSESLVKAIASLEAWDKVKKEMLSQSIIKTHTESYESGFSDGLERAFDIIQDIIEEYLEGE